MVPPTLQCSGRDGVFPDAAVAAANTADVTATFAGNSAALPIAEASAEHVAALGATKGAEGAAAATLLSSPPPQPARRAAAAQRAIELILVVNLMLSPILCAPYSSVCFLMRTSELPS